MIDVTETFIEGLYLEDLGKATRLCSVFEIDSRYIHIKLPYDVMLEKVDGLGTVEYPTMMTNARVRLWLNEKLPDGYTYTSTGINEKIVTKLIECGQVTAYEN